MSDYSATELEFEAGYFVPRHVATFGRILGLIAVEGDGRDDEEGEGGGGGAPWGTSTSGAGGGTTIGNSGGTGSIDGGGSSTDFGGGDSGGGIQIDGGQEPPDVFTELPGDDGGGGGGGGGIQIDGGQEPPDVITELPGDDDGGGGIQIDGGQEPPDVITELPGDDDGGGGVQSDGGQEPPDVITELPGDDGGGGGVQSDGGQVPPDVASGDGGSSNPSDKEARFPTVRYTVSFSSCADALSQIESGALDIDSRGEGHVGATRTFIRSWSEIESTSSGVNGVEIAGTVTFSLAERDHPVEVEGVMQHTTVLLPSWSDADEADRRAWEEMISKLRAHEDGHIDIAETLLRLHGPGSFRITVPSGTKPKDAQTLIRAEVDRMANEIVLDLNRAQDHYDSITNHGKNQEAVGGEDVILDCSKFHN